ncbi:MAG: MGMT family protein, partial [Chloroflexi bacterium]|nr:MGMT family protein [Chloroflexota bacterium]
PDACIAALGPDAIDADHDPDRFASLRDRLARCLDGETVDFSDVTLDLDGAPPFLRAAWEACRSIPAGETRSYKWLAAEAGSPNASRAAGQSMARNRLPLVIPCHRVIAGDGTLGGYGKGKTRLDLKQSLLEAEGAMH